MGIFSNSSPFDQVVEKATLETNTKEDWALILDICDKVGTSPQSPKECLRAIMKRLNNPDPHVAIQAITLLDACVSNCGLPFHLEIASRDFEQEFRKTVGKAHEKTIRDKLLQCLHKWAENEFKTDPQLDLIPTLYNKLKGSGAEFPSDSPAKSKKTGSHQHKAKDQSSPSTSGSSVAQEEADLAKAIELSLKEAQLSPQSRSLYPQAIAPASSGSGGNSGSAKDKEARKVRALYDFEAAEDNELTFYAGEIVHVLDDTDPNWWEGSNQRGTGLFPANFVTADLSAEPPKFEPATKKTVQFADEVEVKSVETEPEVVEIDEGKIDKALNILHDADPTGEVQDPPELASLEDQVQQMGPLIDQELEKIDRRHARLTRLGTELVEALNLYHNLMRDPVMPPQYNMKMGPNVSGPTSMPNFSHAGTMQQPPFQNYPPYDANGMSFANSMMMRAPGPPPHSAPPATGMYNTMSMPFQPPSSNGLPQQINSGPHVSHSHHNHTGPLNIPNNQGPPQQHQQPIPNHQQGMGQMHQQMNMNVPMPMQNVMSGPGGPQFSQPMMMPPHGPTPLQQQQTMHIPPQQPNQLNQSMPPMTSGPSMSPHQGGPQLQQFGPPPPQFYPHPPANAPTM